MGVLGCWWCPAGGHLPCGEAGTSLLLPQPHPGQLARDPGSRILRLLDGLGQGMVPEGLRATSVPAGALACTSYLLRQDFVWTATAPEGHIIFTFIVLFLQSPST